MDELQQKCFIGLSGCGQVLINRCRNRFPDHFQERLDLDNLTESNVGPQDSRVDYGSEPMLL